MKKHTPEAQYNYTCELCDKRFEKLDSVKFHKLKSHPDKQLIWGVQDQWQDIVSQVWKEPLKNAKHNKDEK